MKTLKNMTREELLSKYMKTIHKLSNYKLIKKKNMEQEVEIMYLKRRLLQMEKRNLIYENLLEKHKIDHHYSFSQVDSMVEKIKH